MKLRAMQVKVLASVAVVCSAAAVAGLGTFGSFTSTTSASAATATGRVKIDLGATGGANRLSVPANNLIPGDTVQRAVQLTNSGTLDLASISLSTTASPASVLTNDTTNGLQLKLESCSNAWTEAGTAKYTYTCSGTTKTVLASRPVIGANIALNNLASLAGNGTDNLVATLSLPPNADDSFQGQSSGIGFTFTANTRSAGNQ
jgi:spore coat-associated protein N